MSRRGRGSGSVYFDATKNRWTLKVRDPHTGKRRERSRGLKDWPTKRAAQAHLAAFEAELQRGPQPPAETPRTPQTVADFLHEWLANRRAQVRQRTIETYTRHVAVWVPLIGRIPLAQLDARRIQAALTAMGEPLTPDDEPYAPGTIARFRSTLITALNEAEAFELIPRNPARATRPPRDESPEPPAMTVEEAQQILSSVRGTRLAVPVTLALYYGLRANEVCGLRWEHVTEATLSVQGQLALDRGGLAPAKTAKSMRVLPLLGPVARALEEHRVVQARYRDRAGARWEESGQIVTRFRGQPLPRRELGHWWQKHAVTAGLQPRRTYHGLRHGAATLLMALGVPERVSMEIIGHSSVRVHRRYQHVASAAVEEGLERLARALAGEGDGIMEG